jgi:hypothetical protein
MDGLKLSALRKTCEPVYLTCEAREMWTVGRRRCHTAICLPHELSPADPVGRNFHLE